ncbi:hypothetical protein E1B28_013236 [Marasmius oreades]|uniref:Glucose-methanol-choline oxidoreductase N-terminal domain-containing protein n=1 Tax=Marasmius oreades TaxID=181124 RepID=A0A9P7RPF7_9AGAR|nr:uncharacterized protein E1B28_013236 [Marasmius oreades]KAG7087255.1 hypothetical protein E1B28_013236 [Marasmius oreades]
MMDRSLVSAISYTHSESDGVSPPIICEGPRYRYHPTLATRIVPDAPYPGSQGLRVRTVEVSGSQSNSTVTFPPGPRIMFTANKEIVISAGAIRTPQLLILSGIGPKTHLDSKH